MAKELQPLFLFECLSASHLGETMIILTSITQQTVDENYLNCLYVGSKRPPCFDPDDSSQGSFVGSFYYEYVKVYQNEIGVIFNESLHNFVKTNTLLKKDGKL